MLIHVLFPLIIRQYIWITWVLGFGFCIDLDKLVWFFVGYLIGREVDEVDVDTSSSFVKSFSRQSRV